MGRPASEHASETQMGRIQGLRGQAQCSQKRYVSVYKYEFLRLLMYRQLEPSGQSPTRDDRSCCDQPG